MTENKRFKQTYVCGDYGLIDFEKPEGEQWIDLHSMGENGTKNVQICINIMNELAEENEQLKKENTKWVVDYNALNAEYCWLKDENEQLKLENKTLNIEEELLKENKELKSFIKSLASPDGKIWLCSGYVYRISKILKGDVE